MEPIEVLTPEQINQELQSLPGWKFASPSNSSGQGNKISKQFEFEDFVDSLNFVTKLVPYCEEIDHHPDVHIFYNKVLFELQRFDIGGKVTNKDMLVARKIEELYSNYSKAGTAPRA